MNSGPGLTAAIVTCWLVSVIAAPYTFKRPAPSVFVLACFLPIIVYLVELVTYLSQGSALFWLVAVVTVFLEGCATTFSRVSRDPLPRFVSAVVAVAVSLFIGGSILFHY